MYNGFRLPMFYGFVALNVESEKSGLLDRLHNTCSYGMLIIFSFLLLKANPILFFHAHFNNASVSLVIFIVQSSMGKGKTENIVTRHLWVII